MVKKIIAIVLLVFGVLGSFVLLTYGGPILPHIVGPITALVVGLGLLFYKRKAK